MNNKIGEKQPEQKNTLNLGVTTYITAGRLAISLIIAILLLFAITYNNSSDFQKTLIEIFANPYTTVALVSGIGVYLRTKAREEWKFFGEAILTEALVGFLIELPHIRAVFGEGLKDILVDPKYINSLAQDKRTLLLHSLIKSQLSLSDEYNDVVDFYFNNINKKLSSPQYIKYENHSYSIKFTNNETGLMLDHKTHRIIFFSTASTEHRLRVVIDGDSEYHLNVSAHPDSNFQSCYEYNSHDGVIKDGHKDDKYVCKVTSHEKSKDNQILDIDIISLHPRLEAHIKEESIVAINNSLEWEDLLMYFYDLRQLEISFTLPDKCYIQLEGYGDLMKEFEDNDINTKRTHSFSTASQKTYEASFAEGYSSGSGILTKIKCGQLNVEQLAR